MPQKTRTVSREALKSHAALALALMLVTTLLVLGFGMSSQRADGVQRPEWGKTSAKNGVLRKRCKNYKYSYKVTPPEGDWGLETFLIGPGGKRLGAGAIYIGHDKKTGTDKFRLCKPTTRPGVFKIKAKLSVQSASGQDYKEGWLPVTRFRLRNKR